MWPSMTVCLLRENGERTGPRAWGPSMWEPSARQSERTGGGNVLSRQWRDGWTDGEDRPGVASIETLCGLRVSPVLEMNTPPAANRFFLPETENPIHHLREPGKVLSCALFGEPGRVPLGQGSALPSQPCPCLPPAVGGLRGALAGTLFGNLVPALAICGRGARNGWAAFEVPVVAVRGRVRIRICNPRRSGALQRAIC